MTDQAMAGHCDAPPTRLNPPQVRLPKLVQAVVLTAFRRAAVRRWFKRHGPIFEFNVPFFGHCVAISDPALVRSVSAASSEILTNYQPNVSTMFGPGTIFALDGGPHHDRRRLLAPAFHGRSLRYHESAIVDETLRESANWPENEEFSVLEPMTRITVNVILRNIFGTAGAELAEVRELAPRYTRLVTSMAKFMPLPKARTRRYSPWRRMDEIRRALDRIILPMIERAEADPDLTERTDVLALLLRGRTDETTMSRQDICDELVGLIGAGYETTTAALSWVFERLRRHPDVLAELAREVDEGGGALRRATIVEVLRTRPVFDLPGRWVTAPHLDLGGWRIPQGYNVFVSLADLHMDPEIFPHPERFDPGRFLDTRHSAPGWLAFGHGARRCLGADFAINEIDVVLRTVLQNFHIHTDSAADEKSSLRSVVHAPRRGGLVTVTRRK